MAFAIKKSMVFNVEKLLNFGVDLMLQRRGEKKRPGQKERQFFSNLGRR
jgi:hypothetical protein